MYQAIVFLPLLGCIVAAIISLVGARQRHPGGGPGHHDDHAHAHHAPAPAAAHAAAPHDDHAAHGHLEPPAAGSRAAELVTTLFLFVAMVLSWMAFWQVGIAHGPESREVLLAWVHSGELKIDWGIRVDTLTV